MATLSDELTNLKELLDKGIITQEEFNAKKAQLLAAPTGSLGEAPQPTDNGSAGRLVLGLFIPLVGLILYLVWKDEKPRSAVQAGKGALIGAIVGVTGYIILMATSVSMLY